VDGQKGEEGELVDHGVIDELQQVGMALDGSRGSGEIRRGAKMILSYEREKAVHGEVYGRGRVQRCLRGWNRGGALAMEA
jgi:hypothetical protein